MKTVASSTFAFVILNDLADEEQGDPVAEAYPSFLEDGLRHDPARLTPLGKVEVSRLERLVDGFDTDGEIAPDVTL